MNIVNKWRVTLLLIGMPYAGALHAAECEHSIITQWGTGFTSSLTITNDSSEVINDWAVTMQFPDGATIGHLWNGNVSGSGPYNITNASYNGTIQPNGSISFGYNGIKAVTNTAVEAPVLGGICSGTNTGPTNEAPVAQATASPLSGTIPLDVTFNGNQSSDPDGDTITYLWNFGDGNTSTDASPSHTYTAQGTYNVSLIVSDSNLSSSPATLTITANEDTNSTNQAPIAQATASPLSGTVPFNTTFNGSQSSDPDGDAITYLWNFGDGNTSTDVSPTHTYTQQGNYSVSLIVNDGSLNSAAAALTINANGVVDPTVAYALDSGKSSLHFVSTKKTHVMEVHEFTSLSGSISNDGNAELNISLASVETGIDLRNERMRSLLFEVDTFSQATVTLNVDMPALAAMATGNTEVRDVNATLSLHGMDLNIATQVNVTKLTSGILVESASPILINANDYGLAIGVDALKDAASLDHISYTAPINFTLFFNTP